VITSSGLILAIDEEVVLLKCHAISLCFPYDIDLLCFPGFEHLPNPHVLKYRTSSYAS